jgi:hypothetical protein
MMLASARLASRWSKELFKAYRRSISWYAKLTLCKLKTLSNSKVVSWCLSGLSSIVLSIGNRSSVCSLMFATRVIFCNVLRSIDMKRRVYLHLGNALNRRCWLRIVESFGRKQTSRRICGSSPNGNVAIKYKQLFFYCWQY